MLTNQGNEFPEGFKMTELGLMPGEWKVVRLEDVAKKLKAGGTPSTGEAAYWNGNISFAKVEDVAKGDKYLVDTAFRITKQGLEDCSAWLVPENSILLSMYGTAGETVITKKPVAISQNVLGIVPSDATFPEFLYYALRFAKTNTLHLITDTTIFKHFTLTKAKRLIFSLPPLAEQKGIARVLSTIQQAVETQDKVIAAARELKKSLMRHLFTYGPVSVVEGEKVPLKETEIGPIPEHWKVVTIGHVVTSTRYGISLRGRRDGRYPILRMNNLVDGHVDSSDLQYVNLEDNDFQKFRLCKGDILFNRTNSYELVGKTAIFESEKDCVFASYLVKVVTDHARLDPWYLNHYLNCRFVQDRLRMLATRGVSQSNINATKLRGFRIPLPPPVEQQKIALVLSSVDKKIEAEQKRKTALQTLFKAMLHLLMTGKIRVKDLEAKLA